MDNRKIYTLFIGVMWTIALLLSVLIMVSGPVVGRVIGIVVICLSLATGMLLPNPISFLGLFAGAAIAFLPPWISGLFLLLLNLAGMVSNLVVWLKHSRTTA